MEEQELREQVEKAIQVILNWNFVATGEPRHKAWIIDQVTRYLLGEDYEAIIGDFGDEWDTGIAP